MQNKRREIIIYSARKWFLGKVTLVWGAQGGFLLDLGRVPQMKWSIGEKLQLVCCCRGLGGPE